MPQVLKIGHAGLNVPDLEAALAYYTDTLGLSEVDRADGAVYLGSGADHHSIVLYTAGQPGLCQLAFQISADRALHEVAAELRGLGIAAELQHDVQPGIAELIQIHDPQGNPVLLYSQIAQVRHGFKGHGIVPHKLGHVAQKVQDIDAMVAFYRDVLGFRESDWMEHFFVFLRCGPDHHTVTLFLRKIVGVANIRHVGNPLCYDGIGRMMVDCSRHAELTCRSATVVGRQWLDMRHFYPVSVVIRVERHLSPLNYPSIPGCFV